MLAILRLAPSVPAVRIALVYPRSGATGGVERVMGQLAVHLAEHGHQPVIVCRRHEEAPHDAVTFAKVAAFGLGGTWKALAFASAARRHLDRGGYDRVMAFGRSTGHDVIRLGMGCHATFLERMSQSPRWRDRVELRLEAASLAVPAFRSGKRKVVCNSQLVARDAAGRYGLGSAELTVVPNGVDLDRFHPRLRKEHGAALRQELEVPPQAPLALFLGSGFTRKGLDVVVNAWVAVQVLLPQAVLAVVGEDGERGRFMELAARLGVARRIRFLGERRDAERYYAAADCWVLPTRYDPFANATLEALACGTPVVTTDSNGGSEAVVDGRHGAVVPAGVSAGHLAKALVPWLEQGRDERVRAVCRAQAERFPVAQTATRLASILLAP